MSLVAYGSSDESGDEEVTSEKNTIQHAEASTSDATVQVNETSVPQNSTIPKIRINLPLPNRQENTVKLSDSENIFDDKVAGHTIEFGALPKPRRIESDCNDILEDDDIPLFKREEFVVEKPVKRDRAPVRISVPALSDFKDVDEDIEKSKSARQPSLKGTGLFAVLPPPKGAIVTKKNNLIPHVLTKTLAKNVSNVAARVNKIAAKSTSDTGNSKLRVTEKTNPLAVLGYESNSEDEEESGTADFFSLSKPVTLPEPETSVTPNIYSLPEDNKVNASGGNGTAAVANSIHSSESSEFVDETEENLPSLPDKTLISTVMNLPREEILLKNKAEVGPKLPVPEQEFNVDAEGNVAFDDKAIEYLCGKRGVKRKNQMIDEANIIEINGEDIKPDEREWLVKALTEEPVQRPVSMQGAGPSSQSKKKHQITYLAHQAKAMEVELKNTWSQNRMARKQTQSKYGF